MEPMTFNVIEIRWDGPFSVGHVIKKEHGGTSLGIYHIYGTHNVSGPDTLLYTGRAQKRPFGARFQEHSEEWAKWEPSAVWVYLGRLGAANRITDAQVSDWEIEIAHAEALLIYFCAPPYNASALKKLSRDIPATLVLNHGRRHRLPFEISTMVRDTQVDDEKNWVVHGGRARR